MPRITSHALHLSNEKIGNFVARSAESCSAATDGVRGFFLTASGLSNVDKILDNDIVDETLYEIYTFFIDTYFTCSLFESLAVSARGDFWSLNLYNTRYT